MNQPLPHVSESQIGGGDGEDENWDEGQEGECVASILTCVWKDGGGAMHLRTGAPPQEFPWLGRGLERGSSCNSIPARRQPPLPSPRVVGSRERASFYKGAGAL